MGRRSEGWKLRKRDGSLCWYVAFRHAGRRFFESTGERDAGAAQRKAAQIYAEVVSGRRGRRGQVQARVARESLDALFARWLVSLESELSTETQRSMQMYVAAHFLPYFASLERITAASWLDYARARLRVVQRVTLRKERSAMNRFLDWCVEQGYLGDEDRPVLKPISRKATGTPNASRKVGGWIGLTADEAEAILARLPERTRRDRPVRDYYRVLWETGLRPSAICGLRAPEDYRRGSATLKLRADNDKARFGREVDLTPAARAALDRVCPEAGRLFPVSKAGAPPDFRLTLRKAAREAGLEPDRAGRISDYDFRHGRTTHLVEQTGDILGAGYLVGHTHATTTNRYLHARRSMGRRVIAKVSGGVVLSGERGDDNAHDHGQGHDNGGTGRLGGEYGDSLVTVGPFQPSPPSPSTPQPTDITLVRGTGLEPARVTPPEPKSGASANSAILAWRAG